jgi:hypothetical protein
MMQQEAFENVVTPHGCSFLKLSLSLPIQEPGQIDGKDKNG